MKIKIGDILVSTYGYEACLATFWKVVGLTAKSAKVARMLDCVHTGSWDAGTSAPCAESRLGEISTKKIFAGYSGYEYLNTDRGIASLWDGKPVNTYNHH